MNFFPLVAYWCIEYPCFVKSKTPPLSDITNRVLKSQGILLFVVASIRETDFGSGVNVGEVEVDELFVVSFWSIATCVSEAIVGAAVVEAVVTVVAGLTTAGAAAGGIGDAYIATTIVC